MSFLDTFRGPEGPDKESIDTIQAEIDKRGDAEDWETRIHTGRQWAELSRELAVQFRNVNKEFEAEVCEKAAEVLTDERRYPVPMQMHQYVRELRKIARSTLH